VIGWVVVWAGGRLESELGKRDRRIETLLCVKYSTFAPFVEDVRAKHEKNVVLTGLHRQV
jgi:hypothetical protein